MKFFIYAFGTIMLFTGVSAHGEGGLEMSGFAAGKEDAQARHYQFRDQMEFTISKARFFSRNDAAAFCAKTSGTLAPLEDLMVVAMSGATRFDSHLKDAVYFKPEAKGAEGALIGWTEKDHGPIADVEMVADGGGTSSQATTISEINSLFKSKKMPPLGLNAVCVHDLQPKAKALAIPQGNPVEGGASSR